MSQGPPTPPGPSKLSPEVAQLIEQAVQAERTARQAAEAEAAELKAYNEKLEHLVKEFERAKFGRSSEKLDPEQKELVFEDVETAIGAAQAGHDDKQGQSAERGKTRSKSSSSKARRLPKHLPKDEEHVEPADTTCPCGCAPEHRSVENLRPYRAVRSRLGRADRAGRQRASPYPGEATGHRAVDKRSETSFYVCQIALSAAYFVEAVRAHWSIDNCNHRVRDVTLGEDRSRIRVQPGPVTRFRSFALNVFRADGVRDLALARCAIGLNPDKFLDCAAS